MVWELVGRMNSIGSEVAELRHWVCARVCSPYSDEFYQNKTKSTNQTKIPFSCKVPMLLLLRNPVVHYLCYVDATLGCCLSSHGSLSACPGLTPVFSAESAGVTEGQVQAHPPTPPLPAKAGGWPRPQHSRLACTSATRKVHLGIGLLKL